MNLRETSSFWIAKPKLELIGIILPAFASCFAVVSLSFFNLLPTSVNPITWLIIIVFIDVAHVWSTLFRTYLNKEGKIKFSRALWLTPIFCYMTGVLLFGHSPLTFWRTLAYLAVFHFIRQQYGFYSLYRSKEGFKSPVPNFDKLAIYSSSVIPLIIWHLNGPQNFNWFVPADFFYLSFNKDLHNAFLNFLNFLAPVILICFLLLQIRRFGVATLRTPRIGILLGTYLSWWTGIVWFADDWSFTVTNVISHGVPYFTLMTVMHFSSKKQKKKLIWVRKSPTIMACCFLIIVAVFEEALWDVFLWRDHPSIFGYLYQIKSVKTLSIQALLVPLLALPQATHYALDGLIWRREGL